MKKDRVTCICVLAAAFAIAGVARVSSQEKKDALDAAIRLLAQGMKDVTITDEKGQVYSPSQFVDFIETPHTK